MGLTNIRYTHLKGLKPGFFWDERAPTLEAQVLMPIQDPKEMASELTEVVRRVESDYAYARLFANAFGDPEVTSLRISRALAVWSRINPIGVGPTNPTGKGLRGKDEVSAFYDKHIGPSTLEIETHESHVAANESAHVLALTTTLPNGVKSRVRGIFTYRVNDEGKLTNLRGYWHLGVMEFEQPT